MSTEVGRRSAAPLRIDAHHHLWDLSVRDQPWTADLPMLRRTFAFEELLPHLTEHRIDGTVLVQTVTVGEETPELLALAAEQEKILGVVGWLDLTAADVAERLAEMRAMQGGEFLVGIRHQVQGEPHPEWLLRDDVRRGLRAVADAGLAYDLLVVPHQLPAAVRIVEQMPDLRWVLDHAGKPPIASGDLGAWFSQFQELAQHEQVACKLSGLVTEAAEDWRYDDLAPVADHVLTAFGSDRVMFGSDWPVCLLRAGYDEVVASTDRFLAGLSPDEHHAVWGGTARHWYALDGA